MKAIDGDSHFIEPLDLYERDRALRVKADQSGKFTMVVDRKPMRLGSVEQLLGTVLGYGEKGMGHTRRDFDAYKFKSAKWQDIDARVKFLDAEGFDAQVIYPSMGILWQGDVNDRRWPMRSVALTLPQEDEDGNPDGRHETRGQRATARVHRYHLS